VVQEIEMHAPEPAPEGDRAARFEALDETAVRVLGALMEKEKTTPDNYPLTLNALVAACNQTSNRDPVMKLDEAAVAVSLEVLARRSLVRPVHRSDTRVRRYRQMASDTLKLHDAELAVLCVLMLRGPQTPGEIRTRSGRLFDFPDLARVEVTLQSLITFEPPLVVQLPRRPGQKELRYAHLLGGEPEPEPVETPVEEPAAETAAGTPAAPGAAPPAGGRLDALEAEVADLRGELAALRAELAAFRREFQ
jgi:uncharacterized protein